VRHVLRFAAVAMAAALLAGCGLGGDGEGRSLGDIVREAIDEAREGAKAPTGDGDSGSPAGDVPIRNDTKTAFDYAEYQGLVSQVLASLEDYWARAMPEQLGAAYPGDPSGYFYYRPEEGPGPTALKLRAIRTFAGGFGFRDHDQVTFRP
jgi:hypothetical protein